ncbi:glycoside hydrolase family 2 TIM barrel-domain containing protein [Pseudarthrobacter polychromogenes]|uniref:glycoside hydrolase family 2 TIM barrel-domain containing protein n=1 Tax=Pseudarthrobacter polychromogenes TaxID=1676 RepID=UPI0035EC59D6
MAGTAATVLAETTVYNREADAQIVDVVTEILDPQGILVATSRSSLTVPAAGSATARQHLEISDAALWSPGTPQLHRATSRILAANSTIDTASDDFGIRMVTVDARRGLRINGEPLKLRGAAIHHDNGVIGAHTLDAADERRIRILKESGFNAIRSAHNAASRSLLSACDRHGVLVMDELTDAWFRPKVLNDYSQNFVECWEDDLEALVANAFNHPSVIMYSIGNEIAETATPRGIEMNRRIADRTRELDPTRLVTNGINGFLNLISPQDEEKLAKKADAARETGENPNKNLIGVLNLIIGILDRMLDKIVRLPAVDKRTREAFAALDVAGYNYMTGRYELDAKLHPARVIVGSETRAAHTVKIWKQIEHLDHVIGDFAWTGWDYIGEAGLATKQYGTTKRSIYHPYPALLAGEPVIDITGFRQTQSYLNEIAWHLATGPHIAVEPVNHSGEKVVKTGWRATNSIPSWSWEGCEGREATVEVYADAARIELHLNGHTVGTAESGRDGDYLTKFTLPYQPGDLTAVAYAADGTEIGRRTLTSAGGSLRLDVQPETTTLVADGHDLAYIPIELTDDEGILRPLADRTLTVSVEGAASLLGFGTGEAITTEGFASPAHHTFNGRALAVVRAGHEPGEATVTVQGAGMEPQNVILRLESPAATPSSGVPVEAITAEPSPTR